MPPLRLAVSILALCTCAARIACAADLDPVIAAVVERQAAHGSGDVAFTFDKAPYQSGELSRLPIGIFDSGVGGLTVLEAILNLDVFHNDTLQTGGDGVPDFINERFIYFGDQANMPYGNYSAAGHTDYLRELILKDAVFLLGKRYAVDGAIKMDKPPVKAIVIACNTATAYGLEDVRAAIRAWNLPVFVVGVVEAGARGVKEMRKGDDDAIGVLATVGTCSSGAYPRLIASTLGLAGRPAPAIIQQGSPSLAAVIEGDPAFHQTIADQAMRDVLELLRAHEKEGQGKPIGTVVLGCTHYPLARSQIDAAFAKLRLTNDYKNRIAPSITYVDPAEWTARELFRQLASAKLRAPNEKACMLPDNTFYLSIPNRACPATRVAEDGALSQDYKYGREPGHFEIEDTLNVPLLPGNLPSTSRQLVSEKLPHVWEALRTFSNQ